MTNESDDGGLSPTSPKRNPSPHYNLFSLGAPFVGLLGVVLFFAIVGIDSFYSRTMSWKGPLAMSILGVSCVAGIVFGLMAWARSERFWGVTVLGLLVNAPLPLMLLWTGLHALENWLRYG
jgi:hypothetical protein